MLMLSSHQLWDKYYHYYSHFTDGKRGPWWPSPKLLGLFKIPLPPSQLLLLTYRQERQIFVFIGRSVFLLNFWVLLVRSNGIINFPNAHNILKVGNRLKICIHSERKNLLMPWGTGCLIQMQYLGILKYWFFSRFPPLVWQSKRDWPLDGSWVACGLLCPGAIFSTFEVSPPSGPQSTWSPL